MDVRLYVLISRVIGSIFIFFLVPFDIVFRFFRGIFVILTIVIAYELIIEVLF